LYIGDIIASLTRLVIHVEHETSYPSGGHEFTTGVSGVRGAQSFSFLCNILISFFFFICPFSFGHCIIYPSSIYDFWLPLWYLQTLSQGHTS